MKTIFKLCVLSSLLFASTALSAASHASHKVKLDKYGGWTGLQGKKTGFFHLEEIDGRNWFITPEGNVFYPVALSHMLSGETRTAAKKLFGDDKEAWVRDSVAKVRDLGFNCALGGATSPERNLKEFNEVYGMNLKKISDLKTKALLIYEKDFGNANYPAIRKKLDPRKVEDFNAIIADMCIYLYKMAHTAIRRYDNNHLILGSFIKEWALTGESWKAAAPYLDLIAPQHWNESINISDLSDAAGLPMIVSDEDVGFHYPNNGGNMYKGLVSHEARGEIYQATLMRHYKDPRTLGATFCMCLYDQELAVVDKDQETGIYTIDGKPRNGLMSLIRGINTQVYKHSPHPVSDAQLAVLDETLDGLWKEHDIKAHLRKQRL